MDHSDNNTPASGNQIVQLAVTALLGASGAGAAIAIGGKEGLQEYGIQALLLCIVAAVLFYFGDKLIEIVRSYLHLTGLNRLESYYVSSLESTGIILAEKLEVHKQDMKTGKQQTQDLKADVLNMLASNLRTQAHVIATTMSDKALKTHFLTSIQEVTNKWQELVSRRVPVEEGAPDEEARPVGIE